MEFELNRTQKEIQKAVRDFTKGEFDKELALELDRKHEFPKKIWQKAGDLGLIGVHYPEEYSGQGLGSLEDIIVIEELCRGENGYGAPAVRRQQCRNDAVQCRDAQHQERRVEPPHDARPRVSSRLTRRTVGCGATSRRAP